VKYEKSCGAVLFTRLNGEIRYVLAQNLEGIYGFPKGHVEPGETEHQTALREIYEEVGIENPTLLPGFRAVTEHPLPKKPDTIKQVVLFLAEYAGQEIRYQASELRSAPLVSFEEAMGMMQFENTRKVLENAHDFLTQTSEVTPQLWGNLTDRGICPTCYNRAHGCCLTGDQQEITLYENQLFSCLLVKNPRAAGHAILVSQEHYKDMMDIPDQLCREAFVFAKKAMNAIKEVYQAESIYLCTMCDGPMNHFHLQLIPRYADEKRGSANFVKTRREYIHDPEKIARLRNMLAQ